jgi:hypothetical protein
MPTFNYIARTSAGTLEKGSIEATHAEDAREKLRKRQLMVEELQQDITGAQAVGYAGGMPWTTTDEDTPAAAAPAAMIDDDYIPLIDTLRLFAGWLLAWYGVVFLLGAYKMNEKISMDLPFIQGLFESPLVLRFAYATFLFLLLTSVHIWSGKGVLKGIGLTIAGVALFAVFHVNA